MLAIYTRLSREDEESSSIQNQIREGKWFAEENGYNGYQIYNEGAGVSGTWDIDKRPELFKLIQDIKKNKIHTVWFRNQNRLGRNMETYIAFINVCIKSKTKIFFDGKEFDYTDPTEDLIGNVLSALNSYTTKLQSKQTKKALLDNVKLGKAHSVNAYGYTTDENSYLVVDETESKIVEWMFIEHINGKGCNKIAEELNAQGVPTRYSKLKNNTKGIWHDKTVRDILRNTLYYGRRRWRGEFYDAPAIVTKIIFDNSLRAFEANQNNRGKKVEHKYLLNGIIKCGVCGRNMRGRRRSNGKDNAYTCTGKRLKGDEKCENRSMNIDAMEDFIWNRFFVDNRFLELVKETVEANKDRSIEKKFEEDKSNIDSKIGKLLKEKKKATKLIIKDIFDKEDIESEIRLINNQITDLEIKRDNIDKELNFLKNSKKHTESLESEMKDLKDNTPFITKQVIIQRYIKYCHIISKGLNYFIFIRFNLPVKDEKYFRYKGNFISFNNVNDDVTELVNIEGIKYFK